MGKKAVYVGKLKKVGCYPYDSPRSFIYEGKTITSTHRLAVQLEDDSWVGFGDTDKEDFIVKDDNGSWKILGAGSEVNFVYEVEEKGGKVYKNSKKSLLTVLNLVAGTRYEKQEQSTGGESKPQKEPYKKKDDLAIRLGNALTIAAHLKDGRSRPESVVEFAYKEVYPAVGDLKEKLKAAYPNMDDYAFGMRLGQSAVIASQRVKTIAEVIEQAETIFIEMCRAEDTLRNPIPVQEDEDEDNDMGGVDYDDDIPF